MASQARVQHQKADSWHRMEAGYLVHDPVLDGRVHQCRTHIRFFPGGSLGLSPCDTNGHSGKHHRGRATGFDHDPSDHHSPTGSFVRQSTARDHACGSCLCNIQPV